MFASTSYFIIYGPVRSNPENIGEKSVTLKVEAITENQQESVRLSWQEEDELKMLTMNCFINKIKYNPIEEICGNTRDAAVF